MILTFFTLQFLSWNFFLAPLLVHTPSFRLGFHSWNSPSLVIFPCHASSPIHFLFLCSLIPLLFLLSLSYSLYISYLSFFLFLLYIFLYGSFCFFILFPSSPSPSVFFSLHLRATPHSLLHPYFFSYRTIIFSVPFSPRVSPFIHPSLLITSFSALFCILYCLSLRFLCILSRLILVTFIFPSVYLFLSITTVKEFNRVNM